MATWHDAGDGHRLKAVKGSPEQVLELCRWYQDQDGRHEIDQAFLDAMLTANARMVGEALRVLAFAYGLEDAQGEGGGLIWLGLANPIRVAPAS